MTNDQIFSSSFTHSSPGTRKTLAPPRPFNAYHPAAQPPQIPCELLYSGIVLVGEQRVLVGVALSRGRLEIGGVRFYRLDEVVFWEHTQHFVNTSGHDQGATSALRQLCDYAPVSVLFEILDYALTNAR